MSLEKLLANQAVQAVQSLYGKTVDASTIQIQKTSENFAGDFTLVVFPLSRVAQKAPPQLAEELGVYMVDNTAEISAYNVVKGFLNFEIDPSYWLKQFHAIKDQSDFGKAPATGNMRMVEYASPNTNKPLHLGHLRNIFLGHSVAKILKAGGNEVVKVQIINDRGIHICMSMLAWQRWGNGETPESSGIKGDHLVGKYYVRFNTEYMAQTAEVLKQWESGNVEKLADDVRLKVLALEENIEKLENEATDARSALQQFLDENGYSSADDINKKTDKENFEAARGLKKIAREFGKKLEEAKGALKDLAKQQTAIIAEAREMLRKWEAKDPEVYQLWEMMNGWVYQGFDETYATMGVDFDKLYYESDTWLIGKEIVLKGVEDGIFYRKEDGSVWVDLTDEGMDEKLLLRADGTAVYITQDIGTAILRFQDYPGLTQLTYTVGNEQEYHFAVLFKILEKLGMPWAKECYHLSYGMVELPHGKMKSREGTVVDADDMMAEVIETAKAHTLSAEQQKFIPESDQADLFRKLGLGALKYYLLKVDPVRGMKYDPEESVKLQGNTAPYIQMAYARTRSLLEKFNDKFDEPFAPAKHEVELLPLEKDLLIKMSDFPSVVQEAGANFSPATIANYVYELASEFSSYYGAVPILKNDVPREVASFRVELSLTIGRTIQTALDLLGIEVPERM